jgi:hypothetical protein
MRKGFIYLSPGRKKPGDGLFHGEKDRHNLTRKYFPEQENTDAIFRAVQAGP